MWDYLLAVFVGAAIPLITLWLQRREKRKYFDLERKEKLKLVAIEKRLEVHQQALKHWLDLYTVIHKPDNDEGKVAILEAARLFWYSNSLYLERQTRIKFQEAVWIVSFYGMWLAMYKEMKPGKEKDEHKKFFMSKWDDFHKLFEIIQREVELEPIKPIEDFTPEGELINKEIKKNK